MAKYFLIDYENVREGGLEGSEKLGAEDSLYLFYTKNANKIGLDCLNNVSAAIRVLKVPAGKQSLDMHIASMLGYLAGKAAGQNEYIIVSKDKDFDTILASWNETDAGRFSKQDKIANAFPEPAAPKAEKAAEPKKVKAAAPKAEKQAAAKTEKTAAREEKQAAPKTEKDAAPKAEKQPAAPDDRTALNNRLVKLLRDAGVEGNQPNSVTQVIMASVKKPNPRQAVYLELIKKYGQKEGLKYYKLIKGEL